MPFRHYAESTRQHCAGAMHDLVDAAWRNGDIVGEPVLGKSQRLEEVREEDLARTNRRKLGGFP